MSARKLNKRQKSQAQKNQSKRLSHASRNERDLTRQTQSGELSSPQKGLVICRYSKEFEVEALEGENKGALHRCVSRTNIGNIVAGDKVTWRAGTKLSGVIESRMARESVLERPDNFGNLKEVAANLNQMVIVIACQPSPQTNLIDRYIVAAELMRIKAVLVLNKADLIDNSNQDELDALLKRYHRLGYNTAKIVSSRHQTPQLSELTELIDRKTSIVVGQSGVGKSSLINALLPDANLQVGDLSHSSGEGTHTTTQAKLFHLPKGGQLIDSPGIRDFSLWHIDISELVLGYREIHQLAQQCKFRNCQHKNEPACAVLNGIETGEIEQIRFDSFTATREAIEQQQDRFNTNL